MNLNQVKNDKCNDYYKQIKIGIIDPVKFLSLPFLPIRLSISLNNIYDDDQNKTENIYRRHKIDKLYIIERLYLLSTNSSDFHEQM